MLTSHGDIFNSRPFHGRGALRSPRRRYYTALNHSSPKHFHKILTKVPPEDGNLEFLDPFASQALVASSVFTLLLNPNWFVLALALAASGS